MLVGCSDAVEASRVLSHMQASACEQQGLHQDVPPTHVVERAQIFLPSLYMQAFLGSQLWAQRACN